MFDIPTDTIIAGIFILTYLLISLQRIPFLHLDRPGVSLTGAVLMIVFAGLTLENAYQLIEWNTITLLLGMMIMVGSLRDGGFFRWLSHKTLSHSGNSVKLLWFLVFLSGILSALFVNDTICVLMTPVILTIADDADLNPVPMLIALATSSNIGSVMTLVGNPQNMLVGHFSGIPFFHFFLVLAPVALLALLANGFLVKWIYRKQFPKKTFGELTHFQPPRVDWVQVNWTLFVFGCVLVMFLLGVSLALGALIGAVATLILARKSPQHFFVHVDWSLLLMFASLFVVVGVLKSTHWIELLNSLILNHDSSLFIKYLHFSGITILGSNLVSNVPFVMLIRVAVDALPDAKSFWLLLAMASTFAGNLTLMGSVANLIVAESAKKKATLSFTEFLKVGVPTTIVSTLIGVCWLWMIS